MKEYIKRILTMKGNTTVAIWTYITVDALIDWNISMFTACVVILVPLIIFVEGIEKGKYLK